MKETTGADFKSATDSENKKLFIETYGCQMNVADSEVIASIMQMAGYHVCETLDEADAVFMNTCSIRDNAEQKILNRLEFFHSMKKNKRRNLIVGVLGCMAERVKDDLIENHHVDLVVGPDAYLTLPDLVASVEAGGALLWTLVLFAIVFVCIYGEYYDWLDSPLIRGCLVTAT